MNGTERIVKQFDVIKFKPTSQVELDLPDEIPIAVTTQEQVIEMLDMAIQYWKHVYNQEELTQTINYLLKLSPIERKENLILKKYLKELRKSALIVQACYFFLNKTNTPQPLQDFLKILGKLNDSYLDLNRGSQFAQRLLSIIRNNDLENCPFSATTLQKYQDRMMQIKLTSLEQINKYLMTEHEFHELRKKLRMIKNIYQLAAARDASNQDVVQTFRFLSVLSTKLGKIRGKNIDKTRMLIPPKLLREVQTFYLKLP